MAREQRRELTELISGPLTDNIGKPANLSVPHSLHMDKLGGGNASSIYMTKFTYKNVNCKSHLQKAKHYIKWVFLLR